MLPDQNPFRDDVYDHLAAEPNFSHEYIIIVRMANQQQKLHSTHDSECVQALSRFAHTHSPSNRKQNDICTNQRACLASTINSNGNVHHHHILLLQCMHTHNQITLTN